MTMLLRLLFLLVLAPVVALAVIVIGTGLSLQLAFGPAFKAVAGCTQWRKD